MSSFPFLQVSSAFVNECSNRVSAEVLGNATAILDQLSTISLASALP